MITAAPSNHRALDRSRRLVLPQLLGRSARLRAEKVALRFGDKVRTFAQLEERSNKLANALAARGVGRGDNVAVLLYDGIEVLESFFGCQKLGACPVPVNFRLVRDEIEYILEHSQAIASIADKELAPFAGDGLRFGLVTGQGRSYEDALLAASSDDPDVAVDEGDRAFLMYTSGTTGRPKGAMLSHRNLVMNTLNWVHEMQVSDKDVWLSGLPLFHIGGVNGVLPFLYVGGTTILERSTGFDADRILDLIGAHRVTACCFVPTQWAAIATRAHASDVDTTSLRKALSGASPAPLETLELVVRTFPSAEVVNAYGQTEMSSNSCFLKGADAARKLGSVGKPVVNVEMRVVDDHGRDVAAGEVGEIVYRGPTVMLGYYRDAAATAEAFAGGWFHSGDLVRVDDEGFVYVVDRKKDMIVSGGENVYSAEVERVIQELPAVAEVAVVGIEHPRWVETPLAVVALHGGAELSESELLEHCSERLASYKKPTAVVFVDRLPRNAAGKILKRKLRTELGSQDATGVT